MALSHEDVQPDGEAHHDREKEVDARGGRADGAKGKLTLDVAYDKGVDPVVQLLQDPAEYERHAEADKLARYAAVGPQFIFRHNVTS